MSEEIESLLHESRHFEPSSSFRSHAQLRDEADYERLYKQSLEDPETFWGAVAQELHWFTPWEKVLAWQEPHAQWFVGGKTNISYNALEHQIAKGKGDKPAILWEGEPGDTRTLTYQELLTEVCKFANVLKSLGVKKGEVVAIYMPLIPEAIVAMHACARIGAVHSVVFGGFSASALVGRINDAAAKIVVTADGGYRRGKVFPLKPVVDEAAKSCGSIEKIIVVKRGENDVTMQDGRDLWYHELLAGAAADCPAEPMDAEDPLFILYTSGSTGTPKGVVHTVGGYMVFIYLTVKYVFDLRESDIYWCPADVGWITGHSYVAYGPLLNGATEILYEGTPLHPTPARHWEMIERYGVTIYYYAPTAIRTFRKLGESYPEQHDLSSLRLLGTVGEPINPEAWMWYYRVIGQERCPIVDTWWQTETGGIMITTLPGVHSAKPGAAGRPFFGVDPVIVDHNGDEVVEGGGFLTMRQPWPGMLRTVYGDEARYVEQYWTKAPGKYFAGDGAHQDTQGYYWILGRIDDVLNVSGHRLGTTEIESALVSHDGVAEAAVVGRAHDVKGQAVIAFVTLEDTQENSPAFEEELREHVATEIGAIAKPDEIHVASALPKTRSGKIMRRLLRDVAAGKEISGDISTLEDTSAVEALMGSVQSRRT